MANALGGLSDQLTEILTKCQERGMQMPFIACALSPNGGVYCMRVHGGGVAPDILAKHFEPEGFRVPMTIVVVDQNNEAARIAIEAEGIQFH